MPQTFRCDTYTFLGTCSPWYYLISPTSFYTRLRPACLFDCKWRTRNIYRNVYVLEARTCEQLQQCILKKKKRTREKKRQSGRLTDRVCAPRNCPAFGHSCFTEPYAIFRLARMPGRNLASVTSTVGPTESTRAFDFRGAFPFPTIASKCRDEPMPKGPN